MTLTSSKFCDTCGAANRPQALFCRVCGTTFDPDAHPNHNHQTVASNVTDDIVTTPTGSLQTQSMLKNRYVIVSHIGRGGFGAVYKATDTQLGNRTVAVKEMSQSNLDSNELSAATEAFNHEAHLLAGLNHPNLPRIYEQFTENGRSYLVMDYIDGETLEDRLKRLGEHQRLPIPEVLHIGLQLCAVLEYLHTRQPPIIFRDLKPANIMLAPGGHVYLIDFGIARHFKPGQKKDTTALGSSGYAPPEQYGKSQTTMRADIYSLGATLHQLLTGDDPSESPFRFAPLGLNDPSLAGLNGLIIRMVSVPIDQRPENVTIVRQELHRIMARYLQAQPMAIQESWSGTLPVTLPPILGPTPTLPPMAPVVPAQPAATNGQGSQPASQKKTSPKTAQPRFYPQPNTLFVCSGHTGRITAVQWSPDGKYIASSSYDKTVQLWNAADGKNILTYQEHNARINALAWSPNSQKIVSVGDDRAAQVWEVPGGKKLGSYTGHSGPLLSVAWSADGAYIATAGEDQVVHVWNADSCELVTKYDDHKEKVMCLAWSPTGHILASASKEGKLKVTDIDNSEQPQSFWRRLFAPRPLDKMLNGYTEPIHALSWSLDGKRLAVACGHIVDVRNLAASTGHTIGDTGSTIKNTVAWSPTNKNVLAAGGNDKMVHIWNVNKKKELIYHGHTGYVMALSWSPDGSRIASAGVDRTLQVWQAG